MTLRIALEDFQLANSLYAATSVDVWTVDVTLAKTATRATLYAAPTGSATRVNPVTLDSRGKFAQPIYVEVPVVMTVTPTTGLAHDTAVTGLVSRWRGVWATATLYYPNERVRHPTDATTYVVMTPHTSGVFATDLGAGKLEQEWDADTIAEGVQDALQDYLHAATYGVVGDGVADDTAAMQDFFDDCASLGRPGLIGPGTFIVSGLTLKTNTYIHGAGRENTWLKLKAASNVHVIEGENADALFGGGTYSGIRNFGLFDLGIDGNRANQSPANPDLCCGVAFYGSKGHLARLTIKEVDGDGLRSEWGQYGEPVGGMEARYDDIVIDTVGRHGWRNGGPHDFLATHVIVIDASQETNNTYDGVHQDTYGNGTYIGVHPWHRSAASNRARYGAYSGGYSAWIGCLFEGGRAQFYSAGQFDKLLGCSFFAHYGTAGTAMVTLAASDTIISSARFHNTNAADCFALKIGDGSTIGGYDVEGTFHGFDSRTPFNFANDGGGTIRGVGSSSGGGATAFSGTVSSTSRIEYRQIGTLIDFYPDSIAGRYADRRGSQSSRILASYANTTPGARQVQEYVLVRDTTDATATDLTSDASTISAFNIPVLETDMAMAFDGRVVAYDLGNGNTKEWSITGLIRRFTNVASTTLIGSAASSTYADAGAATWAVTMAAEASSLGGLLVKGAGAAGRTVRWVCIVRCIQVQDA
jgi:hypothetical protein